MVYSEPMSGSQDGSSKLPKSVGEVLRGSTTGLGNLLQQARRLQKLEQEFKSLLDPAMADNVSVAAEHGQILVIVASSAALATRLRMDSKSLVSALNARGVKNISTLQVKTAPAAQSRENPQRKQRQLPEVARQSLKRFAEDIGDMQMKSSLDRHGRDKKGPDE